MGCVEVRMGMGMGCLTFGMEINLYRSVRLTQGREIALK